MKLILKRSRIIMQIENNHASIGDLELSNKNETNLEKIENKHASIDDLEIDYFNKTRYYYV
ncbi:unnamed protein product [Brugia pahangi]|uniref:Uncharacterized protein n=1 Tax=Brugia pahangi TaxID=6280 RepID=A0A0N4TC68_BRUPA|nr:unnamed protein product [Brugia pahangi]